VCLTGHFEFFFKYNDSIGGCIDFSYSGLVAGILFFIKWMDSAASCFSTGRQTVCKTYLHMYTAMQMAFFRSSIVLTHITFLLFWLDFSTFSSPRRLVVSSVVQYVADLFVSADPNRLTAFVSVGDE
jgi:hypothetical protein